MRAVRIAVLTACGFAAVVAVGACGSKKRQKRTGDAAAVEVINTPSLDGGAKASESDEKEPNDGVDVATALAPGSSVRGRIEPDADVDFYRIDVTTAGVLSVQLTAVEGTDLTIDIEDAGGASLVKSDRGAAKVAEGIPNFGVTPGRYTAVVRKKPPPPKKGAPKPKKGAPPPPEPPPGTAPVYHITAQVNPVAKNAEREPDDDRGTANDLLVGDTATGYIGWSNDADVWKLSVEALSAKNSIDIELGAVENVAFTLEIADGVGTLLTTRKAPKNTALVVRGLVPVVPAGAPPYHYLTIKADRSNPETAYTLKITGDVPKEDAEREPNDSVEKAMQIDPSRTVVREAKWTPGDVDCFAIAPDPAARTLEITVETPAEADLRLELNVNGKTVATADQKGKGTQEKVSGPVPANGKPVVCVRGTDTSTEGKYDLSFTEGPAAPAP